jgi:uncharacterized membrane protein YccC
MSRAAFFYGAAVAFGIAWLILWFLPGQTDAWLLLATAVSLAAALLLHERYVRASKGKRWHKTA